MSELWESTNFARKIAERAKRASLNDLDRFKAMIAKKRRNFRVRQLATGRPSKASPKKQAPPPK